MIVAILGQSGLAVAALGGPISLFCASSVSCRQGLSSDGINYVTHRRRAGAVGHVGHGRQGRQLKSTGKTVYDFSLGEPDFTTPEHICGGGRGRDEGRAHPLHGRPAALPS